jgi:hypothetical protein
VARFIHIPSTATVVACLALFVALAGTGAAAVSLARNSVGAPQLKNAAVTAPKIRKNAITSPKVKNSSLLAADFAPGQLPRGIQGPGGPAGPAGPAGPQGAPGAVGPPGTSGYQVITLTSASNSSSPKSLTAPCPAGKRVIGGGARIFGTVGGTAVWLSGPDGTPAAPTEWRAGAQEVGAGQPGNWGLRIDAFCVNVP